MSQQCKSRTDVSTMILLTSCSKELMKHIQNDMGKSTSVWQEVQDSFVSNRVGGSEAKL